MLSYSSLSSDASASHVYISYTISIFPKFHVSYFCVILMPFVSYVVFHPFYHLSVLCSSAAFELRGSNSDLDDWSDLQLMEVLHLTLIPTRSYDLSSGSLIWYQWNIHRADFLSLNRLEQVASDLLFWIMLDSLYCFYMLCLTLLFMVSFTLLVKNWGFRHSFYHMVQTGPWFFSISWCHHFFSDLTVNPKFIVYPCFVVWSLKAPFLK